jgi:hypothetical protein
MKSWWRFLMKNDPMDKWPAYARSAGKIFQRQLVDGHGATLTIEAHGGMVLTMERRGGLWWQGVGPTGDYGHVLVYLHRGMETADQRTLAMALLPLVKEHIAKQTCTHLHWHAP